jgi:sugar phosphate isomerase/epimerase
MKFGICNEIFQGWEPSRIFKYARNTGFDCVEIAPFTIAPYVTEIPPSRRREIRRMAEDVGIEISGIHWVLVQTEGLHLTHPDQGVRDQTSRYFEALVDFCADLGGTRVIVGSPKQRGLLPGVDYETAWRHAAEVFRPAVTLAEVRGVVICFEPLGPNETDFVNTVAEGVRFARQFESESMSVIIDVKAMSTEGRPIPAIIEENAGRFAYFHANDPNLKGPGFGDMDFVPIAAALKATGYDGVVSVEVFKFEEGPETIAERSIHYLKKVFLDS